ncbi:MAG: triose-phosphate isomerase [Burkholderiaceae bacterium]
MTRKPLVTGNWKMNGDTVANRSLLSTLRSALDPVLLGQLDVCVCPPAPYLVPVLAALDGSGIAVGAQNVAAWDNGAYTGEVSAAMLADLGIAWTLIGHSERRTLLGETDEDVATKTRLALAGGLGVIVCVGETLAQREAGDTDAVIGAQIDAVAALAVTADPARFVVAYEPVWAIGTGKTATPEQAQDVHAAIRARLAAAGAPADRIRLLYGGSVKPASAQSLFRMADIDGGLIGGAALVADDFAAICRAALPA